MCDFCDTDPVGFETDIVSSEGGGATSDTDFRPHSLGAAATSSSSRTEQQLRAEIQRLEQRYAQTVSSMTQERQEALANEAAFTRIARDSAKQLQLDLADAESKIEFLAAFVTSQVRFSMSSSHVSPLMTCGYRAMTLISCCDHDAPLHLLPPALIRSMLPPPTDGDRPLQTTARMLGRGDGW